MFKFFKSLFKNKYEMDNRTTKTSGKSIDEIFKKKSFVHSFVLDKISTSYRRAAERNLNDKLGVINRHYLGSPTITGIYNAYNYLVKLCGKDKNFEEFFTILCKDSHFSQNFVKCSLCTIIDEKILKDPEFPDIHKYTPDFLNNLKDYFAKNKQFTIQFDSLIDMAFLNKIVSEKFPNIVNKDKEMFLSSIVTMLFYKYFFNYENCLVGIAPKQYLHFMIRDNMVTHLKHVELIAPHFSGDTAKYYDYGSVTPLITVKITMNANIPEDSGLNCFL